jgi:peptidylprolyl isomerase
MLSNNGSNENNNPNGNTTAKTKVLLETSMGDITIELRDDMPITTENFINLVQQGVYDNTIFHRVKENFMIQGGDPTGTGIGDPSIPNIVDEFSDNPENNKNKRATIAMANKGSNYPNSGSSQFFINVVYNSHLDNLHPVFGDVIDGMDVADEISQVPTDGDPPDGNNKPLEDVTLIRATIIE